MRCGVPVDDQRRRLNKIVNPLSETSPYLRTTLLPGLFTAAVRNISRGNDDLALFEAGLVFFAADPIVPAPRPSVTQRPSEEELAAIDRALGRQPRHLGAVLTGQWEPDGWEGSGAPAGWQQAMAFVEAAGLAIGLHLDRRATEYAPWHPGRCAEFTAADRPVDRLRRRASPGGLCELLAYPLALRLLKSILMPWSRPRPLAETYR